MNTKWNWFIILSLLLGLVLPVPRQSVSAQASATAEFTFTSTPNPSGYGQPVTFTLSATGNDATYPPFGYVAFLDNGVAIPGCGTVNLNFLGSDYAVGVPAVCTTASLTVGTHTITAYFDSLVQNIYASETLTLQNDQIVNDAIPLTISPLTLPDAMIDIFYQLLLIAQYPGGSRCENCSWYYYGDMPEGISLNSSTGEMMGTTTSTGSFSFTVVVDDGQGAQGSQAYTLSVTKVKTIVDVGTSTTYVGNTMPVTLGATARHPDPYYYPQPTGQISFSVNDVPVPGCSGTEAKVTNQSGQAYCTSYIPTGLAAGYYQIQAEFTPDAASSDLYMSGSGTGTLQVQSEAPAQVSGLVFMDLNQDGQRDAAEAAQGNWNVFLNQDCDDFLDWNTVTDPLTGEFSFTNVPTDHTYCLFVDLSTSDGYIQTTPFNNLTLNGAEYFEIGVFYPNISILPYSESLPVGSVGIPYQQTFEVSGGKQPYIIDVYASLPAGLTFNVETLTLSGTPTEEGTGDLNLTVFDAEGITATRTYWLLIQAEGTFELTSSVNPSSVGEVVTFTLSGSGDAVDPQFGSVPPYGFVAFYDGDVLIEGCEQTILNVIEDGEAIAIGDYPATCTTSALTEGQHTITAFFSYPYGMYTDATLTLTQQVGAATSLILSPETLPNAAYQTFYSQQLTVSGGTEPYTFSLLGSVPDGITLSVTGLLSGTPDSWLGGMYIGTYPIKIQVEDANGLTAFKSYDFVLDKGISEVTAKTASEIYWNYPFNISAEVQKTGPDGNAYILSGTVAFYIDDQLVPGCEAVSQENYYYCSGVTNYLTVGTHTLRADYTPTGVYADYYTTGTDSSDFTVQPRYFVVQGFLFEDDDQNGLYESEDRLFEDGWTINLDENCDGTTDNTVFSAWGGFSFPQVPSSGQNYCLTVIGEAGYTQTTQQSDLDFVLTENLWIPIGFYYPTITLSPSEYELPSGSVGIEYNQVFSASGGTAPYTYSIPMDTFSSYPDGVSMSTDGVLSGTPITTGTYSFRVEAKDATGAVGSRNYSLSIKQDGLFSLTSSSNPSAPGEAVTFTVSASGDGLYPPAGLITFSADGMPIEGCSDLNLNIDQNWNIGDYPAICTTAALEMGTHEITAAYTDWMGYNEPTLSLTQVVSAGVSADLSITKADKPVSVKPGSKLLYTLTVSNQGPDTAESVIVSDKLDGSTTYVSVSAPKGWTCSYAENSGTVTCSSSSLASGSSAIIKINVIVNKTAKVGKDLVNNAFVSSTTLDPDLSNNAVVEKTLVVK